MATYIELSTPVSDYATETESYTPKISDITKITLLNKPAIAYKSWFNTNSNDQIAMN